MSSATNTQLRIRFFLKIATLLLYAKFKGIKLMPYCFHRSTNEQFKRYQQGRTKESIEKGEKIVTYIDGYTKISKHFKWLAFDFVIVINGELIWNRIPAYETLGAFWRKLRGKWGGDFFRPNGKPMNDVYHFQD